MTTLAQARERIYNAFVTAWGGTSPLTFDNEAFDPPTGTEWVRVSVRHVAATQDSLGAPGLANRKFQRFGVVFVQVFAPLDKGLASGDTLAHAARNVFEGKTLSPEAIHFFAVAVRDVGPSESWHQTNVEASFIYHETK